jgi:uncharacterized protein YbjT (DUF2867 family)
MKVIVFGASGMVGQGVVRECLAAADVERVLVVVRAPMALEHPKLRQLVHRDFYDYRDVESELTGYDACFFCLGVSSAGMKEADYKRVTYDLTLAAATVLARVDPAMTFVYVSGAGTDSSGAGRSMWARVKGQTENALLALPFKRAYMFRPGFIRAAPGVVSRTALYRVLYVFVGWMYPLLKLLMPRMVSTSEQIAHAMLAVTRDGGDHRILEVPEINRRASA